MEKKTYEIAFVPGDGSAPEMMDVALKVARRAAEMEGKGLQTYEAPMGWVTYEQYNTTLPQRSLDLARNIGCVFFGGVGNPKFDNTIGKDHPEMKPETRCLLTLRKEMGLLLNFRPMNYYHALRNLALVKPEMIPESGITQVWIRFLLQDTYFGNEDFLSNPRFRELAEQLGIKRKADVTGDEEFVADIGYYSKVVLEQYVRAAFKQARELKLPVISIDKANVMARYDFWRKIVTRIGKEEFPEVPLVHQLVDSANALLFTPQKLHGVIICGNEHGDILSDGAAGALGSMGLMCSSAVNPETGAAMFESGAGTAPDLEGLDKANPLGRILTGAMMLRHLGMLKGAAWIEDAVQGVLKQGYRTGDLIQGGLQSGQKLVGTAEMGQLILTY